MMRIALPGAATFVALAMMASSARADLLEHDVPPQQTDPAVSTNLDFHVAYVDTSAPSNGRLFVFLPGTQGLPRFYKLTSSLLVSSETSSPSASGGTFGQSVPAFAAADLIGIAPRTILGAREDASFRTNLILANATEAGVDVLVRWYDVNGALTASLTATLAPLGMTQLTRVLSMLGVSPAADGRLTVSSATAGSPFAAYASVIDSGTNDPRTLLAR